MPGVATAGAVLALLLLLPARMAASRRATGRSGVAVGPGSGRDALRASALMALGTAAVGVGPFLDLVGAWSGWEPGDELLVHAVGFVLLVGGAAWAFVAQRAMGDAWRVGQDEAERTRLVTGGPFGRVRNPIYSGMVAVALGVTLLDPTVVGTLGTLLLAIGVVLQVLRIEEPRLRDLHGAAYHDWARRTGRFLPRLADRGTPSTAEGTAGAGRRDRPRRASTRRASTRQVRPRGRRRPPSGR